MEKVLLKSIYTSAIKYAVFTVMLLQYRVSLQSNGRINVDHE